MVTLKIFQLQAKTRMTMPMPNLLGACGRSIILEGGLKPLKSFLTESFDVRAGLAVQVLQLVEDFEVFIVTLFSCVKNIPLWCFLSTFAMLLYFFKFPFFHFTNLKF